LRKGSEALKERGVAATGKKNTGVRREEEDFRREEGRTHKETWGGNSLQRVAQWKETRNSTGLLHLREENLGITQGVKKFEQSGSYFNKGDRES